MKGLTNVLDRFSEGLRTRKILPSLLEEVSPIFKQHFHLKLTKYQDERHESPSIHTSERLRHLEIIVTEPIRLPSLAQLEAIIHCQGSTTEYAYVA